MWDILDPAYYAWTLTLRLLLICASLELTQFHQNESDTCQVSAEHHLSLREPQTPAELVGRFHTLWTKLVAINGGYN
jgi:hypothetical protein